MSQLGLDKNKIDELRKSASTIVDSIAGLLKKHTTVTVERSILRLLGVDGVNSVGVPWSNIIVDHILPDLGTGVSLRIGHAMLRDQIPIENIGEMIESGSLDLNVPLDIDLDEVKDFINSMAKKSLERIVATVSERNELIKKCPPRENPWHYVIVATGNIYEDIRQAKAAAEKGADIIAVIRTTGQSLLDYVPHGATTEGFGGTYATQENFRIMRKALDEVSLSTGHYVRLVNYASGLCMPEIVVMGAFERLDMMLNDSMYGILFRDINPIRTFVDQYFSRVINSVGDIIINTGEDNYLTTADAVESAHTVLASDLINEAFGFAAGLDSKQLGLGHAFEIDPEKEDSFLLELAQALMVREIFPDSPLKFMPPTKFMSGDIFKGYIMNAMFNLAGIWSKQGIQLLGMLTEAMHTPFVHDRFLALENAKYIMKAAKNIGDAVEIKKDGPIGKRAREVVDLTGDFLEKIESIGLLKAIEKGWFADIKRSLHGGKGKDGVVEKNNNYFNPFIKIFGKHLGIEEEINKWM
jgi:beta-lysine 5,6-aminomutase alpha subunit